MGGERSACRAHPRLIPGGRLFVTRIVGPIERMRRRGCGCQPAPCAAGRGAGPAYIAAPLNLRSGLRISAASAPKETFLSMFGGWPSCQDAAPRRAWGGTGDNEIRAMSGVSSSNFGEKSSLATAPCTSAQVAPSSKCGDSPRGRLALSETGHLFGESRPRGDVVTGRSAWDWRDSTPKSSIFLVFSPRIYMLELCRSGHQHGFAAN